MVAVNLGGEGELPGVLNQQPPWAQAPGWRSSRTALTFAQLQAAGHVFMFCDNTALAFADNSVDVVYTNSVPLDHATGYGPGVQSSEIKRILKPGGVWFKDGKLEWTKP